MPLRLHPAGVAMPGSALSRLTPNGRAFSGEPVRAKRAARVRCNAMLCVGNFVTAETWPREEPLEADRNGTVVILPFAGRGGAIAAAGRPRTVLARPPSCADLPDA